MNTVPHSRESEEAALGSVLINPEAYYEMSRVLKASDFYIVKHQWIWECFAALVNTRTAIDLVTVGDELQSQGHLAEIGGPAYLTTLTSRCVSSLNAMDYAAIIREHSERRTGIVEANKIAIGAYDEAKPFALNDYAMSLASAARGQSKRIDTVEAAEQMIKLASNPRWVSTGIQDIDLKIGGLFECELSIMAGRPGTGKTAVKLQAARKNADRGKKVVMIDCEMTAAQSWFRMACGDLGMDVNQVRRGNVSDETRGQVINQAAELGEKYMDKIVIYQAPISPTDVLSAAMMERPDVIYIDTLKNLAGKTAKESDQAWYDRSLNFLRINVAQAVGCHVQVLHHINREALKQNRPTMGNLMFAGESDADVVFLLHRAEEDYNVVKDGVIRTKVPISWIAAKSRFGWTGEEDVMFDLVHQSFHGLAREPERVYPE